MRTNREIHSGGPAYRDSAVNKQFLYTMREIKDRIGLLL